MLMVLFSDIVSIFSKVENAFYSSCIYINGEKLDKKRHSVSNMFLVTLLHSIVFGEICMH